MSVERDWERIEYKVEKIPVNEIETGRFQSRTRKIEEGLDELAENIRKLGLINPVTVYKRPDRMYELIAGQRRFLAINEILGWKEIPARILPFPPSEIEAKALSFSENVMRNPLASTDLEDSIRLLYLRCGASGAAISRTLGIPYRIVLDVIKYEDLPQSLKEEVDKGEIDVDLAKRATKASITDEGNVDEEKATNLASIMKTLLPDQQKKLIKISKERPEATVDELANEARKIPKTSRVRIIMLMDEFDGLRKYAESEGINEGEAANRLLVQVLKDMGYLT